MQTVTKTLEGLHVKKIINRKDQLALARREFKFVIPVNRLENVLNDLKNDYFYSYFDNEYIYKYRSLYFDTENFKFFQMHRQGKYNRLKIRIREYKNGIISRYLECKQKVKGKQTTKKRVKLDNDQIETDLNQHGFILEQLSLNSLSTDDLTQRTEVFYDRINLIAKNFNTRITIDFNIQAKSADGELMRLIPDYCILEIKTGEYPADLLRILRNNHKIREQNFSKYCVALCLLQKHLKNNKWKQIFKKYFNDYQL